MNKTKKTIIFIMLLLMLLNTKTTFAMENSNNLTFNLNVQETNFETSNELKQKSSLESLYQGKAQPGSSGYFDVTINANNYYSNFNYKILFQNEKNKPQNLYFIVEDTPIKNLENIKVEGYLRKNTTQTVKRIYWKWDYETTNDHNSLEQSDEIDTFNSSENYTFEVVLDLERELNENGEGKLPRTGVDFLISMPIMVLIVIGLIIIIKRKEKQNENNKNNN